MDGPREELWRQRRDDDHQLRRDQDALIQNLVRVLADIDQGPALLQPGQSIGADAHHPTAAAPALGLGCNDGLAGGLFQNRTDRPDPVLARSVDNREPGRCLKYPATAAVERRVERNLGKHLGCAPNGGPQPDMEGIVVEQFIAVGVFNALIG